MTAVSKSSPNPCEIFANVFAEQGETIIASAHFANVMRPIAASASVSNKLEWIGWPLMLA